MNASKTRGFRLISFFTNAPPRVPAPERSVYTAVVVGFTIAILFHIGLTIFWYAIGVREMIIYHIVGIPWLFLGLFVTKRGYSRIGLLMGTMEYLAHGVLGTLYIGYASEIHFPITLAALVWPIMPGRKKPLNWVVPIIILLSYLALVYLAVDLRPRYVIDPEILKLSSMVMATTFFGLLIVLFAYNAMASGWYESLQKEREKSDRLLLNILPEKIAERLKENEEIIADRFDSVSVLFLDIVGFTNMSAHMAAHKVVTLLNDLFCLFDSLAEKHGLEKIKTIGDAYMVVSGIPEPVSDHARRIMDMAVDMLSALEDYSISSGRDVKARIGICSGPVVAGVIGRRKFIYDLWGDTVNTASRMESGGTANRIQVTQSTYDILRDDYEFEERGPVDIKGKGTMTTYFLKSSVQPAPSG